MPVQHEMTSNRVFCSEKCLKLYSLDQTVLCSCGNAVLKVDAVLFKHDWICKECSLMATLSGQKDSEAEDLESELKELQEQTRKIENELQEKQLKKESSQSQFPKEAASVPNDVDLDFDF